MGSPAKVGITPGPAQSAEKVLRLFEKAAVHRGVFLAHEFGKLGELRALVGVQFRGHLDDQPDDEVAAGAGVQRGDALLRSRKAVPLWVPAGTLSWA